MTNKLELTMLSW